MESSNLSSLRRHSLKLYIFFTEVVITLSSKGLGIAAHSTTECKLFTSGRVLYVQWTLCPLQWLGAWSNRTLGELCLWHACQALEVVMTRIAEMGGTKAKVDSYRATVAALVLQIIHTMLRTHLCGAKTKTSIITYMYYQGRTEPWTPPIITLEPTPEDFLSKLICLLPI